VRALTACTNDDQADRREKAVTRAIGERLFRYSVLQKGDQLSYFKITTLRMELESDEYVAFNVDSTFEQPDNIEEYFSLTAPHNTSISRRPSIPDVTNAPMVLKQVRQSFILAEVTVTLAPSVEFDQAGVVIFAGSLVDQTPITPVRRTPVNHRRRSGDLEVGRWAKVGLEMAEGEVHVASTVANTPYGADWSSSARLVSQPSPPIYPGLASPHSVKVKIERVGLSLWIWYNLSTLTTLHSPITSHADVTALYQTPEDIASGWHKMREVTGFFSGPASQLKGSVWVGCYASRPLTFEPTFSWQNVDDLYAEFEDLEIL
jgi:regulation of enolase protein 1 (concanavalin A-like superfamily)